MWRDVVLKLLGKRLLFSTVINSMDPATATSQAIAAFFNFLGTNEGQKVVEDFRVLDAAFNSKLKDLFDKIHNDITGTPTPSK